MMHLKIVSSLSICILVTFAASSALAQTGAPDRPAPQPSVKPLDVVKARAQQIRDSAVPSDRPNQLQDAADIGVDAATGRPQATRTINVVARLHGGLIQQRFTNVITHLTRIMQRADSRIEKMKTSGTDVAQVELLQVEAAATIETAKTNIAAVHTYIDGITVTSDRATVKTELRTLVQTARESVRDAYAAVRAVVKALVGLAAQNRPSSSSNTTSTSTNNQ